MKRATLWVLCVLVALFASCASQPPPREPDPRDIDPVDVEYVVSSVGYGPTVAIEDRALIEELTYSLNGLRSELGVADEEARYPLHRFEGYDAAFPSESRRYEGRVDFFGADGQTLAQVVYYGGEVYRDHAYFNDQGTVLFDRSRLEDWAATLPEGVAPVKTLYYELMWGAEKIWVEDVESGRTVEIHEKELLDQWTDYYARLDFRVDEPCEETAPYRFHIRWTYTENDDLLEEMKIGADGRIQRDGHWCTALNGTTGVEILEELKSSEGDGLELTFASSRP